MARCRPRARSRSRASSGLARSEMAPEGSMAASIRSASRPASESGRSQRPEPGQVGLPRREDGPGARRRPGQRPRCRAGRAARGRRPWRPARAPRRGRQAPRWAARSGTRRGARASASRASASRTSAGRVEEGEGRGPRPCRPPSGSAPASASRMRGQPSSSSVRGWAITAAPRAAPAAGPAARRRRGCAGCRRRATRRPRTAGRVEPDPGQQPLGEEPEAEEPGGQRADPARRAGRDERQHEQRDGGEDRGGHRGEHRRARPCSRIASGM